MRDNEQKACSLANQKNKIRERYKGVSIDEFDIIPALPQEDIFAVENEQRGTVYARVSTDDPRQTSSYELQKNITTMSSAKVRTGSSYRSMRMKASPALSCNTVTNLN